MVKKLALTVAAAVAWFLPAHLVILALLVFFWGTAMVSTTNTALARSTAARVNGVVSQLGTTNANVTNAVNTANSAQSTANNALPISGGTITGSLTVNGNLGVHGGTTLVGSSSCSNDWTVGGNFTADNTSTVFGSEGVHGNLTVLGTINGASIPHSAPGSASAPPTGTGGPSQYCGNFFSGSGAAVWAQGTADKIDQIISALQSAGIFS
jgi:hypothetical protein